MKEEFSYDRKPDDSFNHKSGAESPPPRVCADGRNNIHPIKDKLFEGFEKKVGKKNWKALVDPAPPKDECHGHLQNMRPDPKVMPEE